MAKMRERNEQIEIVLERRHVVLLGFCAIVLGSLLFVLGMMTQKNLMSSGSSSSVGAPLVANAAPVKREKAPPTLFPNRSTEPTVRSGKDFEFYESLTGSGRVKPPKAKSLQLSETAGKASGQVGDEVSIEPAVATSSTQGKPAKKVEAKAVAAKETRRPPAVAGYALQVGSFKDRGGAQAMINRLKAKGYRGSFEPVRLKGGKIVYQVKVGNYSSKKQADATAKKIESVVRQKVLVQKAAQG